MAINMTKGQTVNLSKPAGVPDGFIEVHLDWEVGRGLFGAPKNVDVDIAMLYELMDGTKGIVQALGNSFGSLDGAPWFKLDRDDRTGVTTGETIRGNYGDVVRNVRRAGIIAYVYEGATSLAQAKNAVTRVRVPGQEPCEIRHEGNAHSTKFCAVALLTNTGSGIDVRMDVEPIHGNHRQVDAYWGWGLNWTTGRK